MKGFFITGTDTGVGKTLVSCALANHYQTKISVRKPVESGCRLIDGQLFPADAHRLQIAAKTDEPLSKICPHTFAEPINPEAASILNNYPLDLTDLVSACQSDKPVIVEGVGGWHSPIAKNTTNADLAVQLNLPIILVVADKLGCINHTLLTLESIKSKNLIVHKIYLNQTKKIKEDTNNFNDLKRWTNVSIKPISFIKSQPVWQGFKIE